MLETGAVGESDTAGESEGREDDWADAALEERREPGRSEIAAERRAVPPAKPWYARPGVIAAVLAVLVLVALGGAAGVWYLMSGQVSADYSRQAESAWSDVVTRSDSYVQALNRASSVNDFPVLARANRDLTSDLDTDISRVAGLTPPAQYAAAHRMLAEGLQKYRTYLAAAQVVLDAPATVRRDDAARLSALAGEAEAPCDAFVGLAPFTDDRVPREVWQMGMMVAGLAEKAKAGEAARRRAAEARRKALEQQRLGEQQAVDKSAAESVVAQFTEEYQAGDADGMRALMTVRLRGRFDPGTVFADPVVLKSYEITKTTRQAPDKFEIRVREDHEDIPGNPATFTRLFIVVRVGGKWLVDQWVAPE